MTCDHVVGVYVADEGGFLRASEVTEYLKNQRAYLATRTHMWKWAQSQINLTDNGLLRTRHDMFTYCPYCGAKLL